MKIKKFVSTDMSSILSQVKRELGEDAVIISTTVLSDGRTELIAALDTQDIIYDDEEKIYENSSTFNDAYIRECLAYHELTSTSEAAILSTCRSIASERRTTQDKDILTESFNRLLKYGSLFVGSSNIKMFMGMHGSGKTTALAKFATLAKIRNIPISIISIDNVRAGTNNQLKAFADILNVDFEFIKQPEKMFDKILSAQSENKMILIDTPGINPFYSEDVKRLQSFCGVVNCDKILTIDSGMNANNAVDVADIFKDLGANWLLPLKFDVNRRIGAMLSVAINCGLQIEYAGISPKIANGLAKISSSSLTRIITE